MVNDEKKEQVKGVLLAVFYLLIPHPNIFLFYGFLVSYSAFLYALRQGLEENRKRLLTSINVTPSTLINALPFNNN
jgi:hypothetical protein